ncbi:hypothetical protein [Marinobacter psychrophilus]|uniref:hypothetical protein n=1 Tax=Marinobacter psychrophilus TaxID=330734 RepID=UPI000A83E422|nr:hypothetical protein [Marinobacter psychrophilus]
MKFSLSAVVGGGSSMVQDDGTGVSATYARYAPVTKPQQSVGFSPVHSLVT